jgi:MscS family membrane protein
MQLNPHGSLSARAYAGWMLRSRSFASPSFVAVVVFLVLIGTGYSQSSASRSRQNPTSAQGQHDTEETSPEPVDALGRSTPHGTLLGFLHAAQTGKYKDAAQYLQLSKRERNGAGETLAHQLHELMDQVFVGRIGAVSDKAEGSAQAGVPQDRERIGVFRINRSETNVDLVHVSDSATGDSIWLFSTETLVHVPELYDQIEESRLESELPRFLVADRIFSTPLWRWIAFLVLIPIAVLLASLSVSVLRGGLRVWLRRHPNRLLQDLRDSVRAPAKLIFTVVFHWVGVILLGLPLLFREYYQRIAGIALATGLAWFIVRLINSWAERARVSALANSGYRSGSIILLGQKVLIAVVIIVAGLFIISILGFDMTTAVAGLGIGSLAIAFAAQKTLENLLGGISILGDQVIRVGETCRIGDETGTVEDISLRSTRVRTLDYSELSVPNGQLANMNIENLSRYDRHSFRTKIGLQHGTSPNQLRSLLARMRLLLRNDARVEPKGARIRLVGFGESSLDIAIHCHVLTGDWPEFLAIREDLLLRILDLIAESGIQLAMPARALHLAQEGAVAQQTPPAREQETLKRRQGS